ncbi:MAG: hypothetical protein SCM11_15505 [Bacillota bacterium]|nr:hypothetical protein [Bacillota bacterium]
MPEINYDRNTTMKDAPVIEKLGVVSENGEMTPFVRKGRLMRIESVWKDITDAGKVSCCAIIVDAATGETSKPFGHGNFYFSGYCEDDIVYAFCSRRNQISLFWSDDLVSWQNKVILTMPARFAIANTSVCKGNNHYVMAYECARAVGILDEPIDPDVGHPYTEFFATADNLMDWTMMPFSCAYTKERYNACPAIRYADGHYYMICVEALPLARYAPYIYRTEDFVTWEIGLHNPILMFSKEDRRLKPGIRLSPEIEAQLPHYMNINNSDVDLCEFSGITHIYYLTGNQLGFAVMCETVYRGPLEQFLKAHFE